MSEDHEERIRALEAEVSYLRKRFAQFHPERSYCPHCKALVHPRAKACAACGKSWGPRDPGPEVGKPL